MHRPASLGATVLQALRALRADRVAGRAKAPGVAPNAPDRQSTVLSFTAMPNALDLYDIDSVLSEEERAVRDSVRAFVNDKVLPIIGDAYIEGRFPRELIPELAELGVFGANLPEEYGCAGLNNVSYGLIMQELERGDSGVRSCASLQGALVMYPIFAFGSEEQRREYLPKMARGEVIGCFGLTGAPTTGRIPPA